MKHRIASAQRVQRVEGGHARFVLYRKICSSWYTSYAASVIILLILALISAPSAHVSAGQFGAGSRVGVPAATCTTEDNSWQNSDQAAGKPTLKPTASSTDFSPRNAAILQQGGGQMTCADFALPDQRRQAVGLGLSIGIATNQTEEADLANSKNTADTAAFLLDESPERLDPAASSQHAPMDAALRISVRASTDDAWQPLYTLSLNEANALRNGYAVVPIPQPLLDDLADLSVQFEGLRGGDTSTHIFVDGVFLSYTVGPGQRLALHARGTDAQKPTFSHTQPPAFQVEVDREGEGVMQGLTSKLRADKQAAPALHTDVTIKSNEGKEVDNIDATTTWSGREINGNDAWDITFDQPPSIPSGKNTVIITISDDDGNSQSIKQDFLWGVLAINTHKSVYQPGDKVQFDMSVLDEKGDMVCDAKLTMQIRGPVRAELSSEEGTVHANQACHERQAVQESDYDATWDIPQPTVGTTMGTYEVTLTAQTKNGAYAITDSFIVGPKEAVTVTRTAATRLMPANRYTVALKVEPERDFSGSMTETVPASFDITNTTKVYTYDKDGTLDPEPSIVQTHVQPGREPGTNQITWDVALDRGKAYKVMYTYKAPDVSPAFYLTGPLTMQEGDSTVFREHRQWQIAGDAPWLVGWMFRKALTIDQLVVDANLTNFPVAVKLTASNFDFNYVYTNSQIQGYDIRFTDSDMVTPLNYQRERWNATTDLAEFWVNVPSVSGTVDTVFYIYWGNYTTTTDGQNATAVWDASHQAVYHMNDDPSRVCTTPVQSTYNQCDSTTNGRHGTGIGSMFSDDVVAGKVANGNIFDGTDDKLDFGDVNAVDGITRMTVSGWVKPDLLEDWSVLFAKFSSGTSKWAILESGGGQGTNNDVTVTVSNGTDVNCWTTTNILAAATWGHWVMVFDGTLTGNANRLKFFFNGTQRTLTCTAGGTVPGTVPSNAAMLYMAQYTSTQYMQGTIDEARITNDAKSAAWIKAAYNGDNGTLLKAFGTTEVGNVNPDTPVTEWTPTFDNAAVGTTTPIVGLWSAYDEEGDQLQYDLQIDDNAAFSSPVTYNSANYASNGFDQATFNGSSEPAYYQTSGGDGFVNGGTYYWRTRAIDAAGSNTWSSYSATYSFTINTANLTNKWSQTTTDQFNSDDRYGTQTTASGTVVVSRQNYRYLRFVVTKRRDANANSIQFSEFRTRLNNANVAWPGGTTATNPGGTNPVGETATQAIDGNTATKMVDTAFNGGSTTLQTGTSTLQIDTGAGNQVSFNGYYWATANDTTARDPISWTVYGSNNATTWINIDDRADQTITTSRLTYTSEYLIQSLHDYRYFRWAITARRASDVGVQFSEFQLLKNGTFTGWPAGTTASSPGGSWYPTQGPDKALDSSTATKFLDFNFGTNGQTMLQIDTGVGNTVRFNGYRYITADDASNRDPISWTLYASNDATNWSLLDSQTSQSVTTTRLTATATNTPVHKPGSIFGSEAWFPSVDEAESWADLASNITKPAGSQVLYRFFYATSTVCDTIIPDSSLAGNSAGFDGSNSVDLSGLSTSGVDVLCVEAQIIPGTTTTEASLNDWTISWRKNLPPNAPLTADQKRTDTSASIAVGAWHNQTGIKFEATNITDPNGTDTLIFCVERQLLGTPLSGNPTLCSADTPYSGTPLTMSVTITSATNSQYHWMAWVLDNGHTYNYSSADVSFGVNSENDPDYGIDTSAPTGGTVYDGTSVGVDATFSDTSLSQLSANWSGFSATVSGLAKYQYSIGTSAGDTSTKGWTDNGTTTSVTATGLTLKTAQQYYVNVRAVDNAGNTQSPAISSNGQVVAPSLSFAVSPASMTFSNLNATNSYTDTEDTTLTTSTNAYAGYVVRLAATGTLQAGSYSLGMFSGGSYALPDSWQAGDTGIGYTSSDTQIQGANKFQTTPSNCPGASSYTAPGCYAPYSTTRPGDIIADHETNVTGTPLTNQQFTITHRITASAAQPASTYATVLIYGATALY